MPPLFPLSLQTLHVPTFTATISTIRPATWGTSPPTPPPRSADFFMIILLSIFLFLTAAILRLVPWIAPLYANPPQHWHQDISIPMSHPSEADPLRALRALAPYGALDPRTHPATYEALLEIGDRIGNVKAGFTEEQIAVLETYVVETNEESHHNRRGPKCAICRDAYRSSEAVCVLPCADEFHADCISPWLRLQATCPLCRCRFA